MRPHQGDDQVAALRGTRKVEDGSLIRDRHHPRAGFDQPLLHFFECIQVVRIGFRLLDRQQYSRHGMQALQMTQPTDPLVAVVEHADGVILRQMQRLDHAPNRAVGSHLGKWHRKAHGVL